MTKNTHEQMADALLSILESELSIDLLADNLEAFVLGNKPIGSDTRDILDRLLEAAVPPEVEHIY